MSPRWSQACPPLCRRQEGVFEWRADPGPLLVLTTRNGSREACHCALSSLRLWYARRGENLGGCLRACTCGYGVSPWPGEPHVASSTLTRTYPLWSTGATRRRWGGGGGRKDLAWYESKLGESFEINIKGHLCEDADCEKEVRVLNRIMLLDDTGAYYDADPRHSEMIRKALPVESIVNSPGVREDSVDYDAVIDQLFHDEHANDNDDDPQTQNNVTLAQKQTQEPPCHLRRPAPRPRDLHELRGLLLRCTLCKIVWSASTTTMCMQERTMETCP